MYLSQIYTNHSIRVATGKYCAVALLRIVEMVALHEQNL
jgi:hypothetical protein